MDANQLLALKELIVEVIYFEKNKYTIIVFKRMMKRTL